jgi:hypothetical protein
MFISGPRTLTLGSETGTTSCMLLAGQGGDHLTSSMIYHDSTVTCIPTAIIGGSTACFASTVCVGGDLSVVTAGSTGILFDGTNPTLTLRRNNNGNASAAINFKGSVAVKWQMGTNQAVGLGFEINEGDATTNRLYIAPGGVTTFACQVCAKALTIATECSGVVVDVANRHGFMKYYNYGGGLVGACSGTDSNIAMWLGRFAGTIFSPTAIYQDLVVNGSGNVGIGCIAPNMPLTVAGCARMDKLVINGTGFAPYGEQLQVNGCLRLFNGTLRVSNGGGDGNYVFLTHDDVNGYLCICRTVYAGHLILSPYGGVGIGTNSPSRRLEIVGETDSVPALRISRLGSPTQYLDVQAGGANVSFISNVASVNSQFQFVSRCNNTETERFFIAQSGNVRVSSGKLQINGGAGARAFTICQASGNYTAVQIDIAKDNWGSVIFDARLASASSQAMVAGGVYMNGGLSGLMYGVCAYNNLTHISVSEPSTQRFRLTLCNASGMTHPIVTFDAAIGAGYSLNADDITICFI